MIPPASLDAGVATMGTPPPKGSYAASVCIMERRGHAEGHTKDEFGPAERKGMLSRKADDPLH
eukprot:scaffold7366_cov254-Pinguiococcus_pyrenoidosus.AAC.26